MQLSWHLRITAHCLHVIATTERCDKFLCLSLFVFGYDNDNYIVFIVDNEVLFFLLTKCRPISSPTAAIHSL